MAREVEMTSAEVMKFVKSHTERTFIGLSQALVEEAHAVIETARNDYVPVDTSALRASGRVLPPRRKGHFVEVVAGFGGPDAPYAEVVHEHPSPLDPPSWQGQAIEFSQGGPHYLEIPFTLSLDGLSARIAKRAARGLE